MIQNRPVHYRADIDGLRAVAVLAVIVFHAFPAWCRGGFTGVDIFFVISGFLISSIIFGGLNRGDFRFSEFYRRRMKRIVPDLLLVLVAVLVAGWVVLLGEPYMQLGKHVTGGSLFASNFVLWSEAGYFDKSADTKPLLHLWSLGVEEQFYIVFPFLLWAAHRARANFLAVVGLLGVLSFAASLWVGRSNSVAAFYFPHTRFWELMLGAIAAYRIGGRQDATSSSLWNHFASVAGAGLIGASLFFVDKSRHFPGLWALMPTGGAVLIIWAGERAWLNRYVLAQPLLVWVGLLSFPLYLWHWPVLAFANIVYGGTVPLAVRATAVALSFVAAWLTLRFVERPIRFGDNKYTVVTLSGLLAGVAAFGGLCMMTNGFENRFPPFIRDMAKPIDFAWNSYIRWETCHLQNPALGQHQAECFESKRPLVALWGDSHASSLYPGLKKLQENLGFGLIQLTQAGCPPLFGLQRLAFRANCNSINEAILSALVERKPDIVLLHAAWEHEHYPLSPAELQTKLSASLQRISQALPEADIVILGPVPRWKDSAQSVIVEAWHQSPQKTSLPPVVLPATRLSTIESLLERTAKELGLRYVSTTAALCESDICLSRVGTAPTDVIAIDYGHLSKAGAEYLLNRLEPELFVKVHPQHTGQHLR